MINSVIEQEPNKDMLLVGDFNLPNISWKDGHGHSQGGGDSPFLSCLESQFLYQTISEPTRFRSEQTPSLLDLVITTSPEKIIRTDMLPPFGASDHLCLVTTMQLYSPRHNLNKRVYTDYRGVCKDLESVDWNPTNSRDVKVIWQNFRDVLLETEKRHTSVTWTQKPRTLPFMTPKVKKLMSQKKRAWRKYKKKGTDSQLKKFVSARNRLRLATRKLVSKHEEKIAGQSKENPKAFWKYVSLHKPGRHSIPQIQYGDRTIDQPIDKANAINRQFASVFTNSLDNEIPESPRYDIAEPMPKVTFTEADTFKHLTQLDPNKSKGPDGLHPRLLKETAAVISAPLTELFILSLESTSVPEDWKMAHITPVHKGGKRDLTENYRPISITSVVCKIMEGLLSAAIVKHFRTNNLLHESQHGFTSGKSVETNLLEAYDWVTELIELGFPVDIILLDLAKAFDKVCHTRLYAKLKALGVEKSVADWIREFLAGRKQRVKITVDPETTVLSDAVDVQSGVPQGTKIGPTLFNAYINDAPNHVSNKMNLYADDSKLAGSVECQSRTEQMQQDLDALSKWSTEWLLEFNVKKCKVIHIGSKNPLQEYTMLTTNGQRLTLESTVEERDLGLVVDNNMKFSNHCQKAAASSNQMLGIIKRSFVTRKPEVITKLYKAMVRPRVEFGMIVASPFFKKDKEIVEKVQRRATKIISTVKHLPYEERLKRLKLPTLVYRRKRGDVIQAFKLLSNDTLPQLFTHDESRRTRGHSRRLEKPFSKTRTRSHFFRNRVISLWNELSEESVTSKTVDAFKRSVDKEWETKPWKLYWDAPESSTKN